MAETAMYCDTLRKRVELPSMVSCWLQGVNCSILMEGGAVQPDTGVSLCPSQQSIKWEGSLQGCPPAQQILRVRTGH